MDSSLMKQLLIAQTKSGKEIDISVNGVSMNPMLYQNDIITIKRYNDYSIGDILVFTYKSGELLVHRLLKKSDDKYFCKGDNSFRLEDVIKDQIVGKIIKLNGSPLPQYPDSLINLSYLVNRAFVKCRYDIEKTKETDIYKLYEKEILRKEEKIMIYKKNEAMDYIQADDTSLAVFDPETGDTHFFDETGIDILSILSEPCNINTLIDKLCKIYNIAPEEIRSDVEDFLKDTIAKKVVELV